MFLALVALPMSCPVALAQEPKAKPTSVPRTEVAIELLTKSRFTSVGAQRWGATFAKLGVSARIRPPVLKDKPDVTEKMLGRTRHVLAVGSLEEDGSLVFPGRRFRTSDASKIVEWIEELKTYGAQGSDELEGSIQRCS